MALARKKPAFIGPVRPTSRANMSVAPTTPNMSVAPVPFIGPTRPAPVVNAPVNTVIPIRNDMQANGGAGYNELSRLSASGSVNPDSVQASSFSSFSTGQTSPTPGVTLGQNSSNPTSNVVNAFNMNPTDPANTKAKFDELTVPNYQGVIPAARDTTQKPEADNNYAEIFKQLTDAEDKNKIPSSADAYNRAQRETGILQAQQNVSNLTGTLNGIVAQGQANQLSLVGQGRGIPEAIIGGQQAQIARETAIQALPVSAQLNAAQGNLEMAQANVETLFKIYSDDATNAYNRKTKKNEMVFNFLNAQEKTRLEKIQKLEDRAYTEKQATLKASNEMIINAFSQGASASITNKALEMAKNGGSAVDVAKALGVYSGDYLGNEAKRASIRSSNASAANSNASAAKTRAEMNTSQTVGGKITNPEYAGVINTILGSGKYTKEQSNAIRNAINNGEDPFIVIKNQAKGLMSGANQTKVESYETAKGALTDINSSLKEFYAKGGKTNIFNGNYEKTFNKLGEVKDPKLVNLAVQIQTNLQVYRNAVSGTAYSEQEGKDIASIFPGINKSEGLNTAIMSGRMRAFDSTIDSTYRGTLGSTYDKLKSLNTTQATSGSTPTTSGSTPSGNTWSLPSAWGKINNGQGVTTSGHSYTIIP